MESVTLSRAQKSLDIAKKVADNNKQLEDGKEYKINLSLIGAEKDTVQCISGTVTFKNGVGKVSNNLFEHLGMGATLKLQDGGVMLDGQNTQNFAVSSNFNGINIVGRERDEKEDLKDIEGNHLKKEDINLKNAKDTKNARYQLDDKKFKQQRQAMQDLRAESNSLINKEFQDQLRNMPRLFRMLQMLEDYSYKIADSQAAAQLMSKGANYSSTISAMQDLEQSHSLLHGYMEEAYRINHSHCKRYEEELANKPDAISLSLSSGKGGDGKYNLTKQQFAEIVVKTCGLLCEKVEGMTYEQAQQTLFPGLTWDARTVLEQEIRLDKLHSSESYKALKQRFGDKIKLTGSSAKAAKDAAWDRLNNVGIQRRPHDTRTMTATRSLSGKKYRMTGMTLKDGISVDFSDAVKGVKKRSEAATTKEESSSKKKTSSSDKPKQGEIKPRPRARRTLRELVEKRVYTGPSNYLKERMAEQRGSTSTTGPVSKETPSPSQPTHSKTTPEQNNEPVSNTTKPISSNESTPETTTQKTTTSHNLGSSVTPDELGTIIAHIQGKSGRSKTNDYSEYLETAMSHYRELQSETSAQNSQPTTETTQPTTAETSTSDAVISPTTTHPKSAINEESFTATLDNYARYDTEPNNHKNLLLESYISAPMESSLQDAQIINRYDDSAKEFADNVPDHTAFDWSEFMKINELHHENHHHDHSHTNEKLMSLNEELSSLESQVAKVVSQQEEEVVELDATFDERTLRLVLKHLKFSREEMRKELYEYSNQLQADKKLTPTKRKQQLAIKQEEIKRRQEKELTEKLLKQKYLQRQLYVQLLLKHAKTRGTLLQKVDKKAKELKNLSTQNTHTPLFDHLTQDAYNHTQQETEDLMKYLTESIEKAVASGDFGKAEQFLHLQSKVQNSSNFNHIHNYKDDLAPKSENLLKNITGKLLGPMTLCKSFKGKTQYRGNLNNPEFQYNPKTKIKVHHPQSALETAHSSTAQSIQLDNLPGYNVEVIPYRLEQLGFNTDAFKELLKPSNPYSRDSLTFDVTSARIRNTTNLTIPREQFAAIYNNNKFDPNQTGPTGPQGPQ